MLKRLWADHRNACLLSLALLVVGVMVNPWLFLAAVLPISWVLLKKKPAQDDQPQVTTTPVEETDSIEPLTGPALLAKIKELGDVSKSELVRSCGYYSTKSDGSERLNFTGFYEALLEAKGANIAQEEEVDKEKNEENLNQSSDANTQIDFKKFNADLKTDREVVLAAVKSSGVALEYADESLRADREVVLAAVKSDGGALEYIYTNTDNKEDQSSEIIDRLRESDDVSADFLANLATSDDWEVRRAVAWHDNTPDEILERLGDDEDSDVSQATRERDLPKAWRFKSQDDKVEALKSDDVSLEIIEQLASSENWSIRQAVAWSPSTPESLLSKLKDDDDDDVKEAATTERQLPLDWRFLSSWEKAERLGKESADHAILEILVKSLHSDVRRAVALHPATPERLLCVLREDADESVQSGVRERDLPDSWKSQDEDERVSALKADDVPESVLVILARSSSWTIRQAVALSPGTPQAILEQLKEDDDTDVQSAVRERSLPDDWKQLDEDEKVEKLNEDSADENVLEILSKSGRWMIRQAVAQNAGSSERLLIAIIENDDDEDVIKSAKKSLKKTGGGGTEEHDKDEEHSIYIKTEPGGHILFGRLDADEIKLLSESLKSKELNEQLEEMPDNSYGSFIEADGVVNSGNEGDFGNEGTIVFSEYVSRLGPEDKEKGDGFKDGVYAVIMKLSKCSIEFEFSPNGEFDADKLEEICVPVRLPIEIEHGLYGHPDFNIIIGFKYDGEEIEEDYEVVDRGYDDQFTIFAIKEGNTTIIYSNYNGDEDWNDSAEVLEILEALKS